MRCLLRSSTAFKAVVLLSLAACKGGGDTPIEPPPGPTAGVDTLPAENVREAAKIVYDDIAGGADVRVHLEDIFAALGVPILDPQIQQSEIDQRMQDHLPFAFDVQVQAVAAGIESGVLLDLNSFFTALDENGVRVAGGAGPPTRAQVSTQLAPLILKTAIPRDELLPALVLALGHERASRTPGGVTDDVWGDDRLDPIQFTLLLYAVNMARMTPPAEQISAPATAGRDSPEFARTMAEGKVGALLEHGPAELGRDLVAKAVSHILGFVFTDDLLEPELYKEIACVSVHLLSYRLPTTATPDRISRRNGRDPFESDIAATLVFDFVPSAGGRAALTILGCGEFPLGPVAGKTLRFEATAELKALGAVAPTEVVTGENGLGQVRFTALDEVVPEPLRVGLQDAATGLVQVKASNLVPEWGGMEAVVKLLRNDAGQDGVRLTVNFYRMPAIHLAFSTRVTRTPLHSLTDHYSMTMNATVPLNPTESGGDPNSPVATFAGSAMDQRTVEYSDPCNQFLGTTPDQTTEAGVSFANGQGGEVELYVAPGFANETWNFSDQDPETGECKDSGQPDGALLSAGIAFWNVFHLERGEGALDPPPWLGEIREKRFFFKITGWAAASEGTLSKVYHDEKREPLGDGAFIITTEETTLELNVAPAPSARVAPQ